MRPLALLGLAGRRLLGRPVRSFLLLQGTVWGVAVAIFPSAVIEGSRVAMREHAARYGADRVSIAPDPTAPGGARFDRSDLLAVGRALDDAGDAPEAIAGAKVLAVVGDPSGDPEKAAALVAATPGATRARDLVLALGRALAPGDGPDDCVVEAGVARWLGHDALRPGDDVVWPGDGRRLHVVGVLAPPDEVLAHTNDIGFDVDHPLYASVGRGLLYALGVPIVADGWKRSSRTVWTPLQGDDLDWIFLSEPATRVRDAAATASRALVARGRAPVTLHALVMPFLLGEQVDRFGAVRVALFLACLAMGAVVMTNLGLLTVLRRRREIAIRRVEGATRGDIAAQVLWEGLLLSIVGAVVGSGLGMLLARLRVALEAASGFTWTFPWRDASIAMGVALAIGALASAIPALEAARADPVEGLMDDA